VLVLCLLDVVVSELGILPASAYSILKQLQSPPVFPDPAIATPADAGERKDGAAAAGAANSAVADAKPIDYAARMAHAVKTDSHKC